MTRGDAHDLDRDLATALEGMAPRADSDLLERVSGQVAATPQRRGRAAWRDAVWARWLAFGGVAAVALVVGILIGSSRLLVGAGGDPTSTPMPSAGLGPVGWVEPSAYRYVVSDVGCGGGERNYLGKWELTVTEGTVTVSRPLDETAASHPVPNDDLPTLGWIMEKAQTAESSSPVPLPGRPGESFAERQSPVVAIEWDQFDGHPTLVRIDWIPEAIDDEECYRITSYLPYPPDLAWAEPESYTYIFNAECGLRVLSGRYEVTVEDGVPVTARSLDGMHPTLVPVRDMPTLADLANRVAQAHADEDAAVRAFEVDPQDGHPTRIDIDWLPNAVDDEECYVITDYQITQPSGAESSVDRYTTSVAPDVSVVMAADEVASLVTERMSATKRAFPSEFEGVDIDILKVDAMTYGDAMRANQNLPSVTHDDGSEVSRVVWLVVADGPFATLRGLQPGPRIGTSGYYVIDDLTGQGWGMGFGP